MAEKEKGVDSKIPLSSLGSFDFNTLTKEEALEKFEKVLAQREKQIEDLSLVVGNYNDKLISAYERIKFLEIENESVKEKLARKEKLLEQELENKEIMFIRMQALENELDSLQQKKQKETKKSPIDSFFNFLGGNKKNEKPAEIVKEEKRNVNLQYTSNNNIPINTNDSNLNNTRPYTKTIQEPIIQKPSIPTQTSISTPQNNNVNSDVTSSNPSTSSTEDKSVKLLDKIKALKKKNTEKIVTTQPEEKKEETITNAEANNK